MKQTLLLLALGCMVSASMAQDYRIPVSEQHEQMQTGQYQPTWESLKDTQDSRVVPRCEVRHLGALGSPVRGGLRRLDGSLDVYGRFT